MASAEEILEANEKIVYRTGLHGALLGGPLMLLFITGLLVPSKGLPALLFVAIAVIWGVLAYLSIQRSEFVITDRRVIIRVLMPVKRSWEIPLIEIADADIYQPGLGKLLNFGKIILRLTNGRRIAFRLVSDPYGFMAHLREQTIAARNR
ncbi:MAG TPA: PH domain-containing protein [Syntrophorhabdaceae bacterium]|nr:PH domain-containing protein [Syntrophorhabdaceae bacterium]